MYSVDQRQEYCQAQAATEKVLSDTSETVLSRHCQIFIVGEPASGKTSLYRALTGQDFVEGLDSTDGISVAITTSSLSDDAQEPLLTQEDADATVTQQIARSILCSALEPTNHPQNRYHHSGVESGRNQHQDTQQHSTQATATPNPGQTQDRQRSSLSVSESTSKEDSVPTDSIPAPPREPNDVKNDQIHQLLPDMIEKILEELDSLDWRIDKTFVRCFDCGGQMSFSTTQSVCFGTEDSVYVVTFDMSLPLDSAVETGFRQNGASSPVSSSLPLTHLEYILHWLSTIAMAVEGQAEVVLVGTHSDQADEKTMDEVNRRLKSEIPQDLIRTNKLKITGPVFTDNRCASSPLSPSGRQQMGRLQSELRKKIQLVQKKPVPLVAVKAEVVLRQHDKKSIRRSELHAILSRLAGTGEGKNLIEPTLEYLRKTGSIVVHESDDIVYLNIQWLVEQMTKFNTFVMARDDCLDFRIKQQLDELRERGILTTELRHYVWNGSDLTEPVQQSILNAMARLGLQCPVQSTAFIRQSGNGTEEVHEWHIIPSVLANQKKGLPDMDGYASLTELLIQTTGPVCPHFVFLRVLVFLLQHYRPKDRNLDRNLSFAEALFPCTPQPFGSSNMYMAALKYHQQGIILKVYYRNATVARGGRPRFPSLAVVAKHLLQEAHRSLNRVKQSVCPAMSMHYAYQCHETQDLHLTADMGDSMWMVSASQLLCNTELSDEALAVEAEQLELDPCHCNACHSYHCAPAEFLSWFGGQTVCECKVSEILYTFTEQFNSQSNNKKKKEKGEQHSEQDTKTVLKIR